MYNLISCLSVRKRKSTDFLQNPTLKNGETNPSQCRANRKQTADTKLQLCVASSKKTYSNSENCDGDFLKSLI